MRAAIFSHYDKHGIVDDYVLYSLRCYRQYFDHIIFVSTCKLDIPQQLRAKSFVDAVICRENIGYDFLSWRCGFETLQLRVFDSVTFINDSIYGPCNNMQYMMNQSDSSTADLWGVSINRQFRPHVQSYFMCFKSNLLRSGFANKYWSKVEPVGDKFDLIMRFEVGLSEFVEKSGFSIGALVELSYINRSIRQTVLRENIPAIATDDWNLSRQIIMNDLSPNPVQLFWGEMLRMGAPFVKAELFKSNPMSVNLKSIFDYINKDNWYNTSLILNHLERIIPTERFLALKQTLYST
ncbi:hypothetical protein FV219_03030 [Methylobacterium sp. WL122]|nr:hypothetical protein FV219_03030 [Methylobacterium sp. WL122]